MDAQVKGTTLPLLEVNLQPGESLISTHGELAWMTPNVTLSQSMHMPNAGGGGGGGFMAGLKRVVAGGGLFVTTYQASGTQGMIAFASKMPGRIFPVEIGEGEAYMVHRHGWLCATPGVSPTIGFQQSFRGGLWGGDGFLLEKLQGQGTAWIELAGEIVQYELQAGQNLLVHPGHVGLFESKVNFQVTRMQGINNMMFGGDGFHLVSLSGPGKIWLQTMPLSILAGALAPYLGGDGHDDHHESGGAGAGLAGGLGGGMLGGVLGRRL